MSFGAASLAAGRRRSGPDRPRGRGDLRGQGGGPQSRLLARRSRDPSHRTAVRRQASGEMFQPAASPPAPKAAPISAAGPRQSSGLCSRQDFCISLGRRLAEWRRRGAAPAVLLMRIDDFPALATRSAQRSATWCFAVPSSSSLLRSARWIWGPATARPPLGCCCPAPNTLELIRVAERLRQAVARLRLADRGPGGAVHRQLGVAMAIQMTPRRRCSPAWKRR